jgi:hypothetical protein
MKSIRIGNDVIIHWSIYSTHGKEITPYDLTGKDLKLYVSTIYGKEETHNFEIDGNVVIFSFAGKDQKYTGRYQLILVENEGKEDMRVIDECDAFELVLCLCMEDEVNDDENIGNDCVEVSSEIKIYRIDPIIPEVGENGNWFVSGKDTGKPSSGADAYQIAVKNGYEGSYEEYELLCANIGKTVVSKDISQIIIMKESDYDSNADYGNALIGIIED